MKISKHAYEYMKNEFINFFNNSYDYKCFQDIEKYILENNIPHKNIVIYATYWVADKIKLFNSLSRDLYINEEVKDTHLDTAFRKIFKELYTCKD